MGKSSSKGGTIRRGSTRWRRRQVRRQNSVRLGCGLRRAGACASTKSHLPLKGLIFWVGARKTSVLMLKAILFLFRAILLILAGYEQSRFGKCCSSPTGRDVPTNRSPSQEPARCPYPYSEAAHEVWAKGTC
jgi:hypothetical protein